MSDSDVYALEIKWNRHSVFLVGLFHNQFSVFFKFSDYQSRYRFFKISVWFSVYCTNRLIKMFIPSCTTTDRQAQNFGTAPSRISCQATECTTLETSIAADAVQRLVAKTGRLIYTMSSSDLHRRSE